MQADANPFATFPRSRWIDAQQARYTSLIVDQQYDVLVPPFQASGDSLDAIGRSLLARRIAARIEDASELRVADPSLLERALGEPARTYSREQLEKLARQAGARVIVVGYVRHDGKRGLDLDVEVLKRTTTTAPYASQRLEWRAIPFSDTRIPEYAADVALDKIVTAATGAAPRPRPLRRFDGLAALPIPADFADLQTRSSSSPLAKALYLHLLGELVPDTFGTRHRQQLFERSLVVLDSIAPESAGYRWLRARTLANLGRRPAAIAALGKPSGPSELSLFASLNGDLPSLEKQSAAVASPLLRLLARIDLADVRSFYTETGQSAEAEKLAAAGGEWGPLIYRRATNGDPWSGYSSALLKVSLDRLAPGDGPSAEALLSGAMAEQREIEDSEFAEAVLDHIDRAFGSSVRAAIGARPDSLAPVQGDIIELAQTTVLENCLRGAITERQTRGRPDYALEIIRSCEGSFVDHPLLTLEKAQVLGRLIDKKPERERANLRRDSLDATRNGFVWSGGENQYTVPIAASADAVLPEIRELAPGERGRWLYSTDFPAVSSRAYYAGSGSPLAAWRACLDYTMVQFPCLAGYYTDLRDSGANGPAAAAKLLADNRHRFIGHPRRTPFLAQVEREEGTEDAGDAVLRTAIEEGAEDWEPYFVVGRKQVQRGEYANASRTFLRYPGFRPGANINSLKVSNQAYDAGSLLYWIGQYEAALPLYELAAGVNNGSGASLASAIRLALLEGDLEVATDITLFRAQRYQDEYAYRDYIGLLYVQGQSADADALFDTRVQTAQGPQIWDGALVGHRLRGTSDGEIDRWVGQPMRRKASFEGLSLAPRFLFLSGTLDRGPAPELAGRISALERTLPPMVLDGFEPRQVAGEISDAARSAARATARSTDPLRYSFHALAASGLAALKAGQYQTAVDIFDTVDVHNLGEFLPDYAWAAALAGRTARVSQSLSVLDKRAARTDRSSENAPLGVLFNEFLARAYFNCGEGRHDEALRDLKFALNDRPHTESRSQYTEYRVADAAFRMFEHSRDERLRQFGLDFARRYVRIQPTASWAYAMVARYTLDPREQIPYLATAIHLDRNSWNVAQIDKATRDKAAEWLKQNRPVFLTPPTAKKRS